MALFSLMWLAVTCVMFLCFAGTAIGGHCNFNVKVTQTLRKEGFHRNLTYGVVFNEDDERTQWLYQGCILAIDQMLPRGVFANPDELNDLRGQNRLNAIPRNRINIEMPAEDSQPTSVYVIGKVTSSRVRLWLPVHARYHRARAGGGSVRNEIPKPNVYLHCADERLAACEKNITSVTFLCNGSSKEKCSWKEIPFTMRTSPVAWEVPVGNTDHYYVVAGGTSAVVLIASIYLVNTLHEYKLVSNKKHR